MSTLPERIRDESSATKRVFTLWALALLLAAILVAHGPIAQWPAYHDFADQRRLFGIPNAADVLSNLPFALVGGWGLLAATLPRGWRLFAFALLATAAGSAFYHWAPGNGALVFDRLPIAWACAALLCWWLLLAGYAAAKGFELADRAVLDALGFVGGHTLKHLAAAAAARWIVRAAINSGSRR